MKAILTSILFYLQIVCVGQCTINGRTTTEWSAHCAKKFPFSEREYAKFRDEAIKLLQCIEGKYNTAIDNAQSEVGLDLYAKVPSLIEKIDGWFPALKNETGMVKTFKTLDQCKYLKIYFSSRNHISDPLAAIGEAYSGFSCPLKDDNIRYVCERSLQTLTSKLELLFDGGDYKGSAALISGIRTCSDTYGIDLSNYNCNTRKLGSVQYYLQVITPQALTALEERAVQHCDVNQPKVAIEAYNAAMLIAEGEVKSKLRIDRDECEHRVEMLMLKKWREFTEEEDYANALKQVDKLVVDYPATAYYKEKREETILKQNNKMGEEEYKKGLEATKKFMFDEAITYFSKASGLLINNSVAIEKVNDAKETLADLIIAKASDALNDKNCELALTEFDNAITLLKSTGRQVSAIQEAKRLRQAALVCATKRVGIVILNKTEMKLGEYEGELLSKLRESFGNGMVYSKRERYEVIDIPHASTDKEIDDLFLSEDLDLVLIVKISRLDASKTYDNDATLLRACTLSNPFLQYNPYIGVYEWVQNYNEVLVKEYNDAARVNLGLEAMLKSRNHASFGFKTSSVNSRWDQTSWRTDIDLSELRTCPCSDKESTSLASDRKFYTSRVSPDLIEIAVKDLSDEIERLGMVSAKELK